MRTPRLLSCCVVLLVAAPGAGSEIPKSPLARPTATPLDAIPGVDLSALDDAQKARVAALLKEERCPCGCGMDLFDCRHRDQTCPVSPPLAQAVADGVRAGRSNDEIRASLRSDEATHSFALEGAPSRGAKEARVTIVEFADFQDSATALADSFLKQVLATWPRDVRLVVKHLPADRHPQARFAAEAAAAAHAQNRFWDLHDRMLAEYRLINPDTVREWATAAGLDLAAWEKALQSPEVKAAVDADLAEARKLNLSETPAFFINGRRYLGVADLASVKPVIEAALKASKPAGAKPAGAKPVAPKDSSPPAVPAKPR